MPPSQDGHNVQDKIHKPQSKTYSKSRYNDISAWAVLGLAMRYALVLGLEKAAVAPFQGPAISISEDDLCCMRVWQNLITCDFNLMLTSGLPASLDPRHAASVAKMFLSHQQSQQPGDLRVSGLVELVVIVHQAIRNGNDISGRQLDAASLRKLSADMEGWER